MSDGMRMVIGSLTDTAQLTVSSEVGDLVVANLAYSDRDMVWRSAGLSEVIEGTFEVADMLNCLVLAQHNLTGTSTIRLELLLYGEVVFDSGQQEAVNIIPVSEWRPGIDPFGASYDDKMPVRIARLWLDEVVVADAFRLTIVDLDNPAGYQQAGRLFMGRYISTAFNMGWGVTVSWQDTSEHIPLEGGGLSTKEGHKRRKFAFDLSILGEEDRELLETQLAMSPPSSDIFISLYPGRGDQREITHQMLARHVDEVSFSHTYFDNWETDLQFLEA